MYSGLRCSYRCLGNSESASGFSYCTVCFDLQSFTDKFLDCSKLALVPFLGILNLLAKKQVVKELLQDDFTPENLIKELRNILENAETNQRIRDEMRRVREILGQPGAYQRAADDYLKYIFRISGPETS